MVALSTLATAALALSTPVLGMVHPKDAGNHHNPHKRLLKRAITADASKASGKAFDFVIAGGGLAGLALASRLTEWSNVTVLVIEAGDDGSSVEDNIDIPGYSYLNGLAGTPHSWNYTTVPQANSGNKGKYWPRGKVLGGSGAINGMFFGRAAEAEYDAWGTLNPNGNQTWNWSEMLKYMMKSEKWTPPPDETVSSMGIVTDSTVHGTSGMIQTGYSQWIFPVVANWIPTWVTLGKKAKDLADGDNIGASFTTSTLNAANQSRSDSKAGYIDPLPPRSQLVILTGQQVTKVLFNGTKDASGNVIASGLQFSPYEGGTAYTVQANQEVILSGGVIGSAQILQLSGIGPASTLQGLGIDVVQDLPVGYNLQDHMATTQYWDTVTGIDNWVVFGANTTAKAAALEEWRSSGTGEWTYINEAVGYVSMTDIAGSATAASTFANSIDIAATVSSVAAAHNLPSTVQTGLTAQYNIMKGFLTSADVGQFELILTVWGTTATSLGIQVALQHPWSRGTLLINSTSAFDPPSIDPGYFEIATDAALGVLGWEWARKIGAAAPMNTIMINEAATTATLNGSALSTYYAESCGTEYHPMGTCSMLPQDSGGVVDTNLIVYGTSNLRVIDASIIPLQISAHLMATTYGIAEKGADIIKQAHWYIEPPGASSTAAGPASTAEIGTATDSAVVNAASEAAGSSQLSTGAKIGIGAGCGVAALAVIGALIFCLTRRKGNKDAAGGEKDWYKGDQGAWDTSAAYNEQQRNNNAYPLQRPPRPFSSAGASVSTMATADLRGSPRMDGGGLPNSHSDYSMGDYSRGGATSPFRDYDDHSGYSTPGFSTPGTAFGAQAQTYTPVAPH